MDSYDYERGDSGQAARPAAARTAALRRAAEGAAHCDTAPARAHAPARARTDMLTRMHARWRARRARGTRCACQYMCVYITNIFMCIYN